MFDVKCFLLPQSGRKKYFFVVPHTQEAENSCAHQKGLFIGVQFFSVPKVNQRDLMLGRDKYVLKSLYWLSFFFFFFVFYVQ